MPNTFEEIYTKYNKIDNNIDDFSTIDLNKFLEDTAQLPETERQTLLSSITKELQDANETDDEIAFIKAITNDIEGIIYKTNGIEITDQITDVNSYFTTKQKIENQRILLQLLEWNQKLYDDVFINIKNDYIEKSGIKILVSNNLTPNPTKIEEWKKNKLEQKIMFDYLYQYKIRSNKTIYDDILKELAWEDLEINRPLTEDEYNIRAQENIWGQAIMDQAEWTLLWTELKLEQKRLDLKANLDREVDNILQNKFNNDTPKRWTFINYTDDELKIIKQRWAITDNSEEIYNTDAVRDTKQRTDENWTIYVIPTAKWTINSLIYRLELQQDLNNVSNTEFNIEEKLYWLTEDQKKEIMTNFYENYQSIKTAGTYFVGQITKNLQTAFTQTISNVTNWNPTDDDLKTLRSNINTLNDDNILDNTDTYKEIYLQKLDDAESIDDVNTTLSDVDKNLNWFDSAKHIIRDKLINIILSDTIQKQKLTTDNYKTNINNEDFKNYAKPIFENKEKLDQQQETIKTRRNYIETVLSVADVYLQFVGSLPDFTNLDGYKQSIDINDLYHHTNI